jgi:CCR4-NOT transcription complex subunit 1
MLFAPTLSFSPSVTCPAQVLESVVESRVFRPPNPWVMPLLNTLKELYDVPDIKLSIKFELEVSP